MSDEQVVAPVEAPIAPAEAPIESPTSAPNALNAEPAPAAPAPSEPAIPSMPENWRNLMAGEDEKTLKQLERYTSPSDMAKALVESKQKIRDGLAQALPDDPSDEQIAAYREAHGIPTEATGYELSLDDGLVVGERDQPMVDAYLEAMHGKNATPDQINAGVNAFYKAQEAQVHAMEENDSNMAQETTRNLREEWGNDYTPNINAAKSLLNTVPEAVRESFASARMADGSAMLNSPDVLKWMADTARKANPAATVVPNATNPMQAIGDEKANIENIMRTDPNKYYKDEKMQSRYRELMSVS